MGHLISFMEINKQELQFEEKIISGWKLWKIGRESHLAATIWYPSLSARASPSQGATASTSSTDNLPRNRRELLPPRPPLGDL